MGSSKETGNFLRRRNSRMHRWLLVEVLTGVFLLQVSWDYEDKMVKIIYLNGSVNEFETNYEGKRRKKVDSSGVTYFYYDGDNLLAEANGSDNLVAVYEWGG
jgi:hypothetical protein